MNIMALCVAMFHLSEASCLLAPLDGASAVHIMKLHKEVVMDQGLNGAAYFMTTVCNARHCAHVAHRHVSGEQGQIAFSAQSQCTHACTCAQGDNYRDMLLCGTPSLHRLGAPPDVPHNQHAARAVP
jgi:hypothetical protein